MAKALGQEGARGGAPNPEKRSSGSRRPESFAALPLSCITSSVKGLRDTYRV